MPPPPTLPLTTGRPDPNAKHSWEKHTKATSMIYDQPAECFRGLRWVFGRYQKGFLSVDAIYIIWKKHSGDVSNEFALVRSKISDIESSNHHYEVSFTYQGQKYDFRFPDADAQSVFLGAILPTSASTVVNSGEVIGSSDRTHVLPTETQEGHHHQQQPVPYHQAGLADRKDNPSTDPRQHHQHQHQHQPTAAPLSRQFSGPPPAYTPVDPAATRQYPSRQQPSPLQPSSSTPSPIPSAPFLPQPPADQ